MRIKTTHLILFFPLVAIVLSKGEVVRSSLGESAVIQQKQMDFSSQIRLSKQQSKEAQKLSEISLLRIKDNCIETVDFDSGQQVYYQLGSTVLDSKSKRPIRDGAFVCNALGDTAIIRDGVIREIARVSLKDKEEYNSLFNKGATNAKKIPRTSKR